MKSSLLASILFCLSLTLGAGAEPILGHTLADAKTSDLFQHFALEEETKESPGVHNFSPAGADFKKFVTVNIVLNSSGDSIQSVTLDLARKFIDDPVNGIFARDIAKSFLNDCIPTADHDHYTELIQAIWKRTPSSSPGYTVFLGKSESWSDKASSCFVEFSNVGSSLDLRVVERKR